MRVASLIVFMVLSSCASEKFALAPPAGVDFSGRWKLNEADSDDPQRLVLSQLAGGAGPPSVNGPPRGPGGRGGNRGAEGTLLAGGAPSAAAVAALTEGLRWPGKELAISHVGGVVSISSMGVAQVYSPLGDSKSLRGAKAVVDRSAARGGDRRDRDRGVVAPFACGWEGKTLVLRSGDPDDDHPPFEQRYSVSEDRQRLVEVIGFANSYPSGYTISRVWDRLPAASGAGRAEPPNGAQDTSSP